MKISHGTNYRHACLQQIQWLSDTLIRLETETLYLLYSFNDLTDYKSVSNTRCLIYSTGRRNPNQHFLYTEWTLNCSAFPQWPLLWAHNREVAGPVRWNPRSLLQNRKTAYYPHASVNPEWHRDMRVDVDIFFAGERKLLHMNLLRSPFYRARHQINLINLVPCHVFLEDFPQEPHDVQTLTTAHFRGGKLSS